MDLTNSLRAFVRTLEHGSLTAAARSLGLSQPAVSKLIRNLEAHVGARLLERGPTGAQPTREGARLRAGLGDTLATIDAAIGAARSEAVAIGGTLRIQSPACLGERHLHDIAHRFRGHHPDVFVELRLANTPPDFSAGDIDLAFGHCRAQVQGLVQARIGLTRRYLVAAPAYLAAHPRIVTPAALAEHDLLVSDASLGRGDCLPLRRAGEEIAIPVEPVLRTNSVGVLIRALCAGRGVGTAQHLLVGRELAEGDLVRVLPDWEIRPSDLFVSYRATPHLRPVVRAFIDFAVPALRKVDGIERGTAAEPASSALAAVTG